MRKFLAKLGIEDMPGFWAFAGQFIKFGIVGASNTLLSLGIYYILVYFGFHYILANIIAFAVSVLNAYYWNRRFGFKKDGKKDMRQLAKVYASYGVTFLLSTGLLYLMVDILYVSEHLAPVLNLCVTIPLNFILNKFWAFR